ncbi:PREDICTED: uncharacterized protein LOC109383228 [Hipposideros armiger]|uniref:Uncharacterized protein LOC109383228 n=1 Tax=Hipposideros armiger TaxID=186990 RepID=A0A8B7RD66_HIPAR|nr:PREDICTED: uncharacterized protein LOC109383228 [Hipposideros armiger]
MGLEEKGRFWSLQFLSSPRRTEQQAPRFRSPNERTAQEPLKAECPTIPLQPLVILFQEHCGPSPGLGRLLTTLPDSGTTLFGIQAEVKGRIVAKYLSPCLFFWADEALSALAAGNGGNLEFSLRRALWPAFAQVCMFGQVWTMLLLTASHEEGYDATLGEMVHAAWTRHRGDEKHPCDRDGQRILLPLNSSPTNHQLCKFGTDLKPWTWQS